MRKSASCCRGIALHDAEYIPFGVLAIGKVADAGDRHLRRDDRPAVRGDLRDKLIDGWNVDRVDDRGGEIPSTHDRAVDAGRADLTGRDQPVILWAIPFLNLPAKDLAVELGRAFGIVGGQLEVNYPRHDRTSSLC